MLASRFFYSEIILITTAAALFFVAYGDLRHYKIRNELIALLATLYFLHALVSGRIANAPWNIAFALAMFILMLLCYSRQLMGGGDAKLLTAAFLWVGIDCALAFAILLLICATIHSIAAKIGWAGIERIDGDDRNRIPFAPSIAAALVGVFMLGCLAPIP